MKYDFFINHCKTEKKSCAIPIYTLLKGLGFSVWLDSPIICFGDNIYRKIEDGIHKSTWSVSIISKNFLDSAWPLRELEIFLSIGKDNKFNNILPIYYKISKEEVYAFLPQLADIAFEVINEDSIDVWINHVVCRIVARYFTKQVGSEPWENISTSLNCLPKNHFTSLLLILIKQFHLNHHEMLISIINLYNIIGVCMLSFQESRTIPGREMNIGFNYVQRISSGIFSGNHIVTIHNLELCEVIAKKSVCSVINLFKN